VYPDQEVVAKLAEVDMIVADLERANSRVVTVERRNVRFFSMPSALPDSRVRKSSAPRSRQCVPAPRILTGKQGSKMHIQLFLIL
jgi:hypothetical protein